MKHDIKFARTTHEFEVLITSHHEFPSEAELQKCIESANKVADEMDAEPVKPIHRTLPVATGERKAMIKSVMCDGEVWDSPHGWTVQVAVWREFEVDDE